MQSLGLYVVVTTKPVFVAKQWIFGRGSRGLAARRVQDESVSSQKLRQLGFHSRDAFDAVVLGDSAEHPIIVVE